MHACRNGNKDVVQLLLDLSEDKIINLNARFNNGRTVFILYQLAYVCFSTAMVTGWEPM